MTGLVRVEDGLRRADAAVVVDELRRRNWAVTDGDDWSLFWSFHPHAASVLHRVDPDQRLNHFPGVMSLHRKDHLALQLQADARTRGEEGPAFLPDTHLLPEGADAWRAAARREPDAVWILKPVNELAGRGIALVRGPDADLPEAPGWVIQRYVDDPLLLPGDQHKHALRVFAVITALEPLVVYVHPQPIVKFASRPFSLDHIEDRVRHLTNPSVQRTNTDSVDAVRNMRWSDYSRALRGTGVDAAVVWRDIRALIATTLRAHHESMLRISLGWGARLGCCFDLVGFDLTLDAAGRPWLLECNASPGISFRGGDDSPTQRIQRETKRTVVADLLTLIGVNDGFDPAPPAQRLPQERSRRGSFETLLPE